MLRRQVVPAMETGWTTINQRRHYVRAWDVAPMDKSLYARTACGWSMWPAALDEVMADPPICPICADQHPVAHI